MAQWPPKTRKGSEALLWFILKEMKKRAALFVDRSALSPALIKPAQGMGKFGASFHVNLTEERANVYALVFYCEKDNCGVILSDRFAKQVYRIDRKHRDYTQYSRGWGVMVEDILNELQRYLLDGEKTVAEPATPPFSPACTRLLAQTNENAYPYAVIVEARELERLVRAYYAQPRGLQTEADLVALRQADDLITYEMLRTLATEIQPTPLPADVPQSAFALWQRNYTRLSAIIDPDVLALSMPRKVLSANVGPASVEIDLRTTASLAFPNCFFLIAKMIASNISSETIIEVCPTDKTAEVLSYSDGIATDSYFERVVETYDMYRAGNRNRKVFVADGKFSQGAFPGDILFEEHLAQWLTAMLDSDIRASLKPKIEAILQEYSPSNPF